MVACILCREDSPIEKKIEVFSIEGVRLNICSIISKHFWLRPNNELCPGQVLCFPCWETLLAFDKFYQKVAEAHNRLETKEIFVVDGEDDPLPHEVVLKSEELSCAGQLVEALGEDFFDSEIKVEVNDLDLLPQIEIIEDKSDFSQRALRSNRRGRPAKENADKNSPTTKRIKREKPTVVIPADDSENEPLKVEVDAAENVKTVKNERLSKTLNSSQESLDIKPTTAKEQAKKRRGRPKKVKEEEPEESTTKIAAPPTTTVPADNPSAVALFDATVAEKVEPVRDVSEIKAERAASESDDDCADGREFVAAGLDSGTDDTSSSSDSDSDFSLPEVEPHEEYATIPKRVVVKPKKYRKREKPLVPPKRMSREEIEQKNAQQAEYDKILKQFFTKFACPICNLLVVDFATMKKHFRASHDDVGYLTCCGKKFFLRKTLVEHIYVHWNPEHFKCAKCGKICQDSKTLELHENSHTNPPEVKEKKTFQCDKCPKAFTTKAAFEYHSFSKHVPKSEFKFNCPECKKKLPTERKLKDHIKYTHDPESAIICDKCGKKMRSQSNLKKHHALEHSDAPRPVPVPMQCEICGTWLRHIAGLKQHMKTIHEEAGGEHRCHICNKQSTNARALKRHIYHNHECERKFKCTMCEKAFKRPQDLREHTSTHTGEVLYTCPNCPMTFFSNANMYKHRQRLHRAEWEAERKKPGPANIMQRSAVATAAMKMQQAVGAASAFFANKAELHLDASRN